MFDPNANLDKDPQSGFKEADFDAVISDEEWLQGYFNGDENHEQVRGVTVGNTYHIYRVRAYGDVADYMFRNDDGKEMSLGSFFFKPVEKDGDAAPAPKTAPDGAGNAVPGDECEWAVLAAHRVSPMWRPLWHGDYGDDGDLAVAKAIAAVLGRLVENGRIAGRNGVGEIQPFDRLVLTRIDKNNAYVTDLDIGGVPYGTDPVGIPEKGFAREFHNKNF